MQKMRLRPGLCSGPHWRTHDALPNPLVGWGGDTPAQTAPHSAPSVPRPSGLPPPPRRHNVWLGHWLFRCISLQSASKFWRKFRAAQFTYQPFVEIGWIWVLAWRDVLGTKAPHDGKSREKELNSWQCAKSISFSAISWRVTPAY